MDEKVERRVSDQQGIDEFSKPAEREQPITPDRILSAVGNEHRRAILDSLTRASDGTLEYDALVERVADLIRDEDTERVSDEHRQRVRIALHHTHLPKLAEAGVVEYDRQHAVVRYQSPGAVEDVLQFVSDHPALTDETSDRVG